MDAVNRLIDQARVILTAAVSWIIAAVAVLQFVLTQDVIADYPVVAEWIGRAISLLGGVILVIRRVTPVAPAERGILPQ